MRNYLRSPEFVVNTLCLLSTGTHWNALGHARLNPIDEHTIVRIEALYSRKADQEKDSRQEPDLPARRKKRIPRASGQYASKLSMTSANKGANPPTYENPFRLLINYAAALRHPRSFNQLPVTRKPLPHHSPLRITYLDAVHTFHTQWSHHSHYFGG